MIGPQIANVTVRGRDLREIKFDTAIRAAHKKLKQHLVSYLVHSRLLAVLSAPVIYVVLIPFLLLDVTVSLYQAICFTVYEIPKVNRADYIIFDRAHLRYLNLLERLNCLYCSYANGVCGYVSEIAARTEQHWCPIKHAQKLRKAHSRYGRFLEYGDAEGYRTRIEAVRNDFDDAKTRTSKATCVPTPKPLL